jgi:DMSO/TMAO reductase YedYZ molybdopterin-dependent catalytic subunit
MKNKKIQSDWDHLTGMLEDNGAHPRDVDRLKLYASRRTFLGKMGTVAALAGLGASTEAAMTGLFGRGLIPVAWAEEADLLATKDGMTIHNKKPINGEFEPQHLDDDITPPERHFVRNNGEVPDRAIQKNLQGWKLLIDGEVHRPLELTYDDLMKFPQVNLPLLVECGGNGRDNFDPKVRGNPWNRGAVGCSMWTGVPLREVLKEAGLKTNAIYTGHYGEDPPLGEATPFSRGVPIAKAMEPHTLIAFQMGGKPLPALNGYPVRLVVPGWVGSCSQKWLNRIWIRNVEHDSHKMTGYSYRVPKYPVVPGVKPPKEDMEISMSWIIKSMITRPTPEAKYAVGQPIQVRGHAWAGEDQVIAVMISLDYGVSWQPVRLIAPPNRYAWYTFETTVIPPSKGYFEIWARAFDDKGRAQPFRQPWNPKGYLGNVVHRVPVLIDV